MYRNPFVQREVAHPRVDESKNAGRMLLMLDESGPVRTYGRRDSGRITESLEREWLLLHKSRARRAVLREEPGESESQARIPFLRKPPPRHPPGSSRSTACRFARNNVPGFDPEEIADVSRRSTTAGSGWIGSRSRRDRRTGGWRCPVVFAALDAPANFCDPFGIKYRKRTLFSPQAGSSQLEQRPRRSTRESLGFVPKGFSCTNSTPMDEDEIPDPFDPMVFPEHDGQFGQ